MKSPLIYRATGLEAYLIDPKEVQKLAPILKTSDIEVKLHYHFLLKSFFFNENLTRFKL
jgi:hypothetical protein